MKATLEKVDNGFILETKDEKRVGMTLNDILPTIYDLMKKEMINCIEEVGQMCWKLEIEINVTPTTKQDSDCEVKVVPCKEKKDVPIGEVIEYKGKHLLCTETEDSCLGCYFADKDCSRNGLECEAKYRADKKSVIFVWMKNIPKNETKEVPCDEPEIGSVIEYEGKRLLCVEADHTCKGCYFEETETYCGSVNAACNGDKRKDGKSVIFVGEKKE